MGVRLHEYRKKCPWVVTWKNPWTKKKHTKAFATENEALIFEEAQEELAERERQILKRTRQKKAKVGKLLVCELFRYYFSNSPIGNLTRIQSQYHANQIIMAFGRRDCRTLDKQDIMNFSYAQHERGISQSTVYHRVSILRRALNWAVENLMLEVNPLQGLRLPRSRSRRIAPPTPMEIRAMLNVAAPHIQRIIILGLFMGPRIGPSELFRLKWKDVDFSMAMCRMPCAAKNRQEDGRDIPIRKGLTAIMEAWYRKDKEKDIAYVISWGGRKVRNINRAWHSALHRAGIERRIRPYDLRHAFATYALAGAADIGSVASIMGHADASMILKTYQHVQDTQKRAAVEAVSDVFGMKNMLREAIPGV